MSMQHSPQTQPKNSEGKNNISNQQNVFLDVVDAFQNYIGNKLSMDWRGINMWKVGSFLWVLCLFFGFENLISKNNVFTEARIVTALGATHASQCSFNTRLLSWFLFFFIWGHISVNILVILVQIWVQYIPFVFQVHSFPFIFYGSHLLLSAFHNTKQLLYGTHCLCLFLALKPK